MHFYNPSFLIFSFDDGVDDSVQNNFQVMFGGFSLIFVYIAITLGRWNALEQRVRKTRLNVLIYTRDTNKTKWTKLNIWTKLNKWTN